jgi:hypothetical protein
LQAVSARTKPIVTLPFRSAWVSHCPQESFANLDFVTDGDGPATAVVLHDPGNGLRRRARDDAPTAAEVEANFKRRMAAAPDRFRDQAPAPGAGAGLRAMIEDLRHDAPGSVRMSLQLADRVRQSARPFSETLRALGAVKLIFFRGMGPGGYVIYGVKFANGVAEFRIDLAADGTIENFNFRPGGDGTLGGIAACTLEPTLQSLSQRLGRMADRFGRRRSDREDRAWPAILIVAGFDCHLGAKRIRVVHYSIPAFHRCLANCLRWQASRRRNHLSDKQPWRHCTHSERVH